MKSELKFADPIEKKTQMNFEIYWLKTKASKVLKKVFFVYVQAQKQKQKQT